MGTSRILRTLSFGFPAKFSPTPVAPWPVRGEFDLWLGAELDNLQRQRQPLGSSYTSAAWVTRALDVAVAAQEKTTELISASAFNRRRIDDHLEDVVELLDACNSLRERMETVMKYAEPVSAALRCLEGRRRPHEWALRRARDSLSSCESMEKRWWSELDKCEPGLSKLGERLACGGARQCSGEVSQCSGELEDALGASKAMTLLACGVLAVSLSFKSKRGLPVSQCRRAGSWASSLQQLQRVVRDEMEKRRKGGGAVLEELRWAVEMAREVRSLMQKPGEGEVEMAWRELKERVEMLGRRRGELEEGMKMLEGRVNGLYRHLISVRMALLDALAMASEDGSR